MPARSDDLHPYSISCTISDREWYGRSRHQCSCLGVAGGGFGEPFVQFFIFILLFFFGFLIFDFFFWMTPSTLKKSKRRKEVIASSGKRNPGEILPCGRILFKPRSPLNDVRLDRVDPDPSLSTRIRIPCHLVSPVPMWIKLTCSVESCGVKQKPKASRRG